MTTVYTARPTLFSIVVPTRDNLTEFRATIDSILSEAPPCSEIIIVDSSNPPIPSPEIQRINDSRYIARLIHTEPRGIFEAINDGIKLAKGNWIVVLTAGDGFVSGARQLLESLGDSTEDVYVFSQNVLDPEYNFLYQYNPTDRSVWPHQSVVVRSNVYSTHGLYDVQFRVSADARFFAKIRLSTNYLIRPEVLTFFCLGGISNQFSIRSSMEIVSLHRQMGRSTLYCLWRGFISPLLRSLLVILLGQRRVSIIKATFLTYYKIRELK